MPVRRADEGEVHAKTPVGTVSVPSHIEHEKRFIGRRLPAQPFAGAIDRGILIETDSGHLVLEDLQRLAIPGEALGLIERCPRLLDRFVERRILELRPAAGAVEQRLDDAVPLLASTGPTSDRPAAS